MTQIGRQTLSGRLTTLLQCFDTVGWVIRPVKNRRPYNLYCVGADVKPCSINQTFFIADRRAHFGKIHFSGLRKLSNIFNKYEVRTTRLPKSSPATGLNFTHQTGVKSSLNHRLRGSASPVLTATHHSYGSPILSDFFFPLGSGGQTPQRTFTQNGSNDVFSRKDVPFAVKVATFHTPWSLGPLIGQNFANFWT